MGTKLYVSLKRLNHNIDKIKERLNEKTGIIAMVKANAYGAGMVEVSKYLQKIGIKDFGVALVGEAVNLRKNGINDNIIVTSQFLEDDIIDIINYDLSVSLSSIEMAKILNDKAKECGKSIRVHIKIDTGMTRLGFDVNNVIENICYIKDNLQNIVLDGLYTHLSSAESNKKYTLSQIEKFDTIYNTLLDKGVEFKYVHILNSVGVFLYPQYQYSHVRVGIAMYGYLSDNALKVNLDLKPILKLTTNIIHINELQSNTSVSYDRTYNARVGERIAVIPIGYADGLPRELSNNYTLEVGDIIGNICMDMCMISLNKNLKIGDEVDIFDFDDNLERISKACNTINYEIISRIGHRVKRVYV